MGHLAQALNVDMATQADVLWKRAAWSDETREPQRPAQRHNFKFNLWDLGSLSSRLAANDQATPAVKQAASEVSVRCSRAVPSWPKVITVVV